MWVSCDTPISPWTQRCLLVAILLPALLIQIFLFLVVAVWSLPNHDSAAVGGALVTSNAPSFDVSLAKFSDRSAPRPPQATSKCYKVQTTDERVARLTRIIGEWRRVHDAPAPSSIPDHMMPPSDESMGSRFVILTDRRTGSTWFKSQLRCISPESMIIEGEIFSKEYWEAAKYPLGFFNMTSEVLLRILHDFYSKCFAQYGPQVHCGFKFMYNQLPKHVIPTLATYLEKAGVIVYHLIRENSLGVVLSQMEAKETGIYTIRSDAREQNASVAMGNKVFLSDYVLHQIRFHTLKVEAWQSWRRREMRRIRPSSRYVEIYYEDLKSPQAVFYWTMILAPLQIYPVPERWMKGRCDDLYIQLHKKPCNERIENWDEVVEKIGNTPSMDYCNQQKMEMERAIN